MKHKDRTYYSMVQLPGGKRAYKGIVWRKRVKMEKRKKTGSPQIIMMYQLVSIKAKDCPSLYAYIIKHK